MGCMVDSANVGAAGVSGCGNQRRGEHQLPGGQRGVVVQPGLEQPERGRQRAGDAGRFIELGSYGPTNSASTNDWWALLMSSDGNTLSFCTETNGALTTNVTQSISWTNNTWHQIALIYGPTDR